MALNLDHVQLMATSSKMLICGHSELNEKTKNFNVKKCPLVARLTGLLCTKRH